MKWHVSWRRLVWSSDLLHRGTFFVHPFFFPSSSSSSFFFKLNYLLLQSFPIFKILKNDHSFFFWAFMHLCIQWDYTNMSVLAVHCLMCFLYVVSNLALFSTVSPVCSACHISIFFLSSILEALRKMAKSVCYLHRGCPSVRLSVCPSVLLPPWNTMAPTGRILMDIWVLL